MNKGGKLSRVMVVDDEPGLCDLVEVTLKKGSHEVLVSFSGEEAIKRLEKEKPDLVLLDIGLPCLDGWEVLKQMSAKNTIKDIPVAMLTNEELTLTKILKKDLDNLVGYIEKPFSPEELLRTVEDILQRIEKVYRIKKRIERSPSGGEALSRAYLAWSRTQMIHERLLEKLKQLKTRCYEVQKRSRIESLIADEKQTVERSKIKKEEIMNSAGIRAPNPKSSKL